jgi:hypothetical protein
LLIAAFLRFDAEAALAGNSANISGKLMLRWRCSRVFSLGGRAGGLPPL